MKNELKNLRSLLSQDTAQQHNTAHDTPKDDVQLFISVYRGTISLRLDGETDGGDIPIKEDFVRIKHEWYQDICHGTSELYYNIARYDRLSRSYIAERYVPDELFNCVMDRYFSISEQEKTNKRCKKMINIMVVLMQEMYPGESQDLDTME